MKRYIFALLLVCIPIAAYAITTSFTITVTTGTLNSAFNCSGFTTSPPCNVFFTNSANDNNEKFMLVGAFNGSNPALSGSAVNLVPINSTHVANNLNWRTAVNVGQFSTTFTFVPDGQGIAFILSNNGNQANGVPAASGGNFVGGASCEGSFFQGFTVPIGPGINNTFAVMLDSYGGNTANNATFTYSNVQYYDVGHPPPNPPNGPGQSPCNPDQGSSITGFTYVGVNKISTSPVPLNNPVNAVNTTTGHTYSATISYDGSNLTISLFDVTAGGACPGATCFTNTWTGVNIPAIVGGPTAWVGLGAATGISNPNGALLINSWSYSAAPPPLTSVFNCTGFAASGPCATGFIGSGSGFTFKVVGTNNGATPGFSGSQVNLIPANSDHVALNMNYQPAAVNVGQFSTTFTFVPNGWNLALILSNNTVLGTSGPNFGAGAGCEASFFQGFGQPTPPNNTFALELDQVSNLLGSNQAGPGGGVGVSPSYSSVQYYSVQGNVPPPNAPNPPGASPCIPDLGSNITGFTYVPVNKVSTSPVALNNPATTVNTTTGHTYSVTLTYDGSNLTVSLYDVTAGGSCPGAQCFTNTWTGVNIPAIVGGPTAYVGLGGGTNNPVPNPLLINTWSYSSN